MPANQSRMRPLVYVNLRRLAEGYLRSEAPGRTLHTMALVHEAFLGSSGPAMRRTVRRVERLAAVDPRKACLVELRFLGWTECGGVSRSFQHIRSHSEGAWQFAKPWLLRTEPVEG
jgi:hypothetical protein